MTDWMRIGLGCCLAWGITVLGVHAVEPGMPLPEIALASALAIVIAAAYGISRL